MTYLANVSNIFVGAGGGDTIVYNQTVASTGVTHISLNKTAHTTPNTINITATNFGNVALTNVKLNVDVVNRDGAGAGPLGRER